MLILGVDPGSIRCGYGAIDGSDRQPRLVECGVLTAPKGRNIYSRLSTIQGDLESLLDELRPGYMALEAGYVPTGKRAERAPDALVLAGARAICGTAAARRGISVIEYPPSTVKKCACGRGDATKEQVAAIVVMRLRMKRPPEENAADALAVALTHYQHMGTARARKP